MRSDLGFYLIDHRLIALAMVVVLAAACEIGYRAGSRKQLTSDSFRSLMSGIGAATLGLLGLLLGFTLSMAIARWDARRDVIVNESNAGANTETGPSNLFMDLTAHLSESSGTSTLDRTLSQSTSHHKQLRKSGCILLGSPSAGNGHWSRTRLIGVEAVRSLIDLGAIVRRAPLYIQRRAGRPRPDPRAA